MLQLDQDTLFIQGVTQLAEKYGVKIDINSIKTTFTFTRKFMPTKISCYITHYASLAKSLVVFVYMDNVS